MLFSHTLPWVTTDGWPHQQDHRLHSGIFLDLREAQSVTLDYCSSLFMGPNQTIHRLQLTQSSATSRYFQSSLKGSSTKSASWSGSSAHIRHTVGKPSQQIWLKVFLLISDSLFKSKLKTFHFFTQHTICTTHISMYECVYVFLYVHTVGSKTLRPL